MWSKRIKIIPCVLYKILLGWVKYNWNVGADPKIVHFVDILCIEYEGPKCFI